MAENKRQAAGTETAQPLIIEAELLDPGPPAPRPGDMYIISLMRYLVLKVLQGEYPHPFILVGHDLPDLSAQTFQIGARHRLYLVRLFPKHASILNKFEHKMTQAEIFFCSSFDDIV